MSYPPARFLLWLAAHDLTPDGLRPWLLRRAGHHVARSAVVFGGLRISGEGRLSIGEESFVSSDCHVDCSADVEIGPRVALGTGTRLVSSTHDLDDPQRRAGERRASPIHIGAGCWLGAGSTVLGGIRLGAGVVVAAGAVVTAACAADTLHAGVPARKIRDLPGHDWEHRCSATVAPAARPGKRDR